MPGIAGTMQEFKAGALHSGSPRGPKVTNRKQAIAIALSQARRAGQNVAPMPMHKQQMSGGGMRAKALKAMGGGGMGGMGM